MRVAIAGLGAIGRTVASALADNGIPGFVLTAVSAKNHTRAKEYVATFAQSVKVVDIAALEKEADLVIECAPAALLSDIATPFLQAQKQVMVLSVGALLFKPELIALAEKNGGVIRIPSGALLGLDAIIAAAEGKIDSVRMVTRKPLNSLAGAPYLVNNQINIEGCTEAIKIFEGNAREAAMGFPANVNVVAALALAGIGPDQTMLEIWADPLIERNVHTIFVAADAAKFSMSIENVPSENPKTSKIVAQSVIATLRKMRASLKVGT